jgi:hypothetical protein
MSISTSGPATDRPRAASAAVDARLLRVTLIDGREIGVPVEWFDWLARGTPAQRADLTIIEGGAGIWWEQLEDGVSIPGLLGLPEYP